MGAAAEVSWFGDFVVALDYSQFSISTTNAGADQAGDLVGEALEQGIAQRGHLIVVISPHQNNVKMPLRVEVWTGDIADDLDDWEEAFAVGLTVDDVGVFYTSPTLAVTPLAVPAGTYRLLITGRGFVAEGWPGSTTPGDSWRFRLTPTGEALIAPTRLKAYSAPDIAHPPREYAHAGIEAVRRIHEALDGAPALSGRRRTVSVERRFPGGRRKLYRSFRDPSGWLTSGGSSGQGGYLLTGGQSWAGDSPYDHPNLIVSCNGEIEAEYLDGKSPTHSVSSWTWRRLSPDRLPQRYHDGRPGAILVPPTPAMTVRFDLTETKDDNNISWTTVRLEHANVPSEWAEDLLAYWRWALERADYDLDFSGTRTTT